MSRNMILVVLIIAIVAGSAGCATTEDTESTKLTSQGAPIVGGVAVGISPKLIHASVGENVSFSVDLLSSENADDVVTVNLNGQWIDESFLQEIRAGESLSIPMQLNVPQDAENTTVSVTATSHNLDATSGTTGFIIIN